MEPLTTARAAEDAANGARCPQCGYWNSDDANVRDADDGRMFCNYCGVLFHVEAPRVPTPRQA
jgi:transcription elongation factor Elf1